VVAVSEAVRAAVARGGVGRDRLALAPAFLGTGEHWPGLPGDLRAFLEAHQPVLVATLFFRPEYGLEPLLDALVALRAKLPAIGCLLLGGGTDAGGPAWREACAAFDRRGLGAAICFAGDVPHELAIALMARADAFVRPTLADGDSVSVREALALGVPTVATDAAVRPAGTVLCRRGDARDLAAATRRALARGRGPIQRSQGGDAARALLDLYAPTGGRA
jgi:glycosyltransferase involved in cell wall biosynthesis